MVQHEIRSKIKKTYEALGRINVLSIIVAAAFFLLVGRLFYLQVIKGAHYSKMADNNCVSLVKLKAPRGEIYDRNYVKLVANKPSYMLGIIPYHFARNADNEKAVNRISAITSVAPEIIEKRLKRRHEYILEPVIIKRDIESRELFFLEEIKNEVSGITILQEPKRHYDHGNAASHVLGYVGEISEEQLKMRRFEKHSAGDIIGQAGVESFYDQEVRGKDGAVYILTDAQGRQKEIMETIKPEPGKNLVLTIDLRLQRFTEDLLEARKIKGVVIAADPKTGEILCMVSKPDFNLGHFSGRINVREWKNLIRNKDNPMTNRAVQGLYSPGSIFKIPVGYGALEDKINDASTSYLCEGIHWIKTWPYKCWRRTGHGWVDFNRSMAESCDVYFYKSGIKMTVEGLHKYALMFGLGEKTGIDLPGERSGVVPSREWKRRVVRSPWFPGNTVMMSIGQGYMTSTPIQMLNLINVMANDGYAFMPRVLKAVTADDRKIIRRTEIKKLFEIKISRKNLELMRRALRLVVSGGRGTGAKSRIQGIRVAGKTATVENPQGENHAMFVAYAPYEKPEISVYVLVEHGGGGGDVAAPVAKEVMEYYLKVLK